MQQAIRNAADSMLTKTVKTYTFNETVLFGSHPFKNLPEILGQYPNQGIGFKIWRKTWPATKYIIVKEAQFKNLRNAKFFGIEYYKGRPLTPQPVKVRNGSKRGVWKFDVNGATAISDNGVNYSNEELVKYMIRHQNHEKKQEQQQQQQQQQQEQEQQTTPNNDSPKEEK